MYVRQHTLTHFDVHICTQTWWKPHPPLYSLASLPRSTWTSLSLAPIDVDELVAHAPAPTSSDWLLLLAHRSHGHNSWAHSSTRRLTPRSSALDSVSCAARLFHHSTASASPPTPPLRCDHCLRPDPQSLSHNATDTHSRRPAPWSNPSVRPALQSRSRRRSTYGTRSP